MYFDRTDLASGRVGADGSLAGIGIQVPAGASPGGHWVSAVASNGGGAAQVALNVEANWPQLGGPDSTRDGYNPFENMLDPVTAGSIQTIATASSTATIRSSPAVVGDVAYVGSDNGVLYAFQGCASGTCRTLWRGLTKGHIVSSPAYTSGTVVVASEDGTLYAFPATCGTGGATCQPRWTASIGKSDSSPLVVGNRLFVGSSNGNVYAFPAGGCGTAVCTPLWTANVGGSIQGGPAYAAGVLFTGSSEGTLHALDADTGTTVWSGGTAGSIVGSPAVNRTDVFVGTTTGTLYAFRTGCASGGRSCAPAWTAHGDAPIDATPALAYDQVIVGTTSGELYSWSTLPCDTPPCAPSYNAKLDGAIVGSPAVANGVAYATTRAGSLYMLDAKRLGVESKVAVGASQASPAVANGDVYVADTAGTLDVLGAGPAPAPATAPPVSSLRPLATPIRHIVVLYQENHSFDNVLGALCVEHRRCDGALTGLTALGRIIPLTTANDNVVTMNHGVADQLTAIDGGRMDGFSNMSMCAAATGYACYTQYLPAQIPNLAALAQRFTISDRTFELKASASFGSHLELASGGLDGYLGDNPPGNPTPQRPGWGCDSNMLARWISPAGASSLQPACVPWPNGFGTFKRTLVSWVPTIMDRLDTAGYTWNIYAGGPDPKARSNGYVWAICPTLADCVYSAESNAMRPSPNVIADAASGSLPSVSFVQPSAPDSQHSPYSMIQGDNWIGSVVGAIESGPEWDSTAIFVTYDDCGCYYDHVPPPDGLGVRVPMVIVSPYVRAGSTDSTTASLASILAYVEHTLGVPPLTTADANAYDYRNSFDYVQQPLAPVKMASHPVPKASRAWIRAHPDPPDDPT